MLFGESSDSQVRTGIIKFKTDGQLRRIFLGLEFFAFSRIFQVFKLGSFSSSEILSGNFLRLDWVSISFMIVFLQNNSMISGLHGIFLGPVVLVLVMAQGTFRSLGSFAPVLPSFATLSFIIDTSHFDDCY